MIPIGDLKSLALTRLAEAETLARNGHLDGAIYLCGYSVEMALKARICETLSWDEFPSTKSDFQDYQSFRTHNLAVLLHLSGMETLIKTNYLIDWSIAIKWNPELRYSNNISLSIDHARMIKSARTLLTIF